MTACKYCNQEMTDLDKITCTITHIWDLLTGQIYARPIYEPEDKSPDHRCHDCGIKAGGYHHPGCDVEICPKCGGQMIVCGCIWEPAEAPDQTEPFEPLPPTLREALAAHAHVMWAGWMQYQFEKGAFTQAYSQVGGALERVWVMPPWAVTRWTRQMETAYAALPEEEKESDRQEADRILALLEDFKATPQPLHQPFPKIDRTPFALEEIRALVGAFQATGRHVSSLLLAWLDQVEDLTVPNAWISVADEMPEKGETVLGYDSFYGRIGEACWSPYHAGRLEFVGSDDCNIVAWMPLPNSPANAVELIHKADKKEGLSHD